MDTLLIARSVRKSTLRTRILQRLARRGKAYPELLAEDLDVSVRDLRRAMHGRLPQYAPHLSPIRLRLAIREGPSGRRVYAITPLGRRVVRELRKLRGRR